MAGFSLKKKDDKPKAFGGFSLKKKALPTKTLPKAKAFGDTRDEEDEAVKTIQIDTYDAKDGAYDKETGPIHDKGAPLVIPNAGNHFIPQANPTSQEPPEKKLVYGLNQVSEKKDDTAEETHGASIPHSATADEPLKEEASMDDYEEVPVEDFGAAMLRGMGFSGTFDDEDSDEEPDTSKMPVIPVQKRKYLGLGAKALPMELDDEPVDKVYVPVKMINRRTGEVVPETQQRERSPTRRQGDYRSRS